MRRKNRRHGEEPQNKAAARDAIGVSIVRGGRRFCNFAGRKQLVERAPVSRMPICGVDHRVYRRWAIDDKG